MNIHRIGYFLLPELSSIILLIHPNQLKNRCHISTANDQMPPRSLYCLLLVNQKTSYSLPVTHISFLPYFPLEKFVKKREVWTGIWHLPTSSLLARTKHKLINAGPKGTGSSGWGWKPVKILVITVTWYFNRRTPITLSEQVLQLRTSFFLAVAWMNVKKRQVL